MFLHKQVSNQVKDEIQSMAFYMSRANNVLSEIPIVTGRTLLSASGQGPAKNPMCVRLRPRDVEDMSHWRSLEMSGCQQSQIQPMGATELETHLYFSSLWKGFSIVSF